MSATLHAPGRPVPRRLADGADRTPVRDEMVLALAMALLLALVIALALIGAASIARPLFMLSGLAIAFEAKRRSPWLFLSATLWFSVTTALARRIIEWHGGFDATDIVLVTPSLMSALIVPGILTTRGLLTRQGVGCALLLSACTLYGLFVSFMGGNVLGGLYSAVDWLVPLLFLFLFIGNAARIDEAESHICAFLSYSLPFVVGYALYQYFRMPAWDAAWMVDSRMGSLGQPLPMSSHVFGSMNSPGSLAIWDGTCLVLLPHLRSRALLLLVPFMVLLLAISMVRALYGSVLLATLVGALISRGGFGRMISIILLAGIGGYAGVALLNPQVVSQIATRVQSIEHLEADDSAQVRRMIYAETPRLISENPFGTGIGAQGRGQAAQGGDGVRTINIDSGLLSVFLGLGWVAGPLYIACMALLQVRALRVGRRYDSRTASAMAAAAIVPLGTFPFVNVIGFGATVLWMCLGYALAVEIRATARAPR